MVNLGSRLSRLLPHPIARRLFSRREFRSSSDYWDSRYRSGGNSGGGSYGRLAAFKAEVVNDVVKSRGFASVIELGCGDGAQLELATYPDYSGLDVSPLSVERCRKRFRGDPTKRFFLYPNGLGVAPRAEVGLSLDVIYHLVEDDTFNNYMKNLFHKTTECVIIYSSDVDQPHTAPHVRHRKFTDWISEHAAEWRLVRTINNRYPAHIGEESDETSFANFYLFEKDGRLPEEQS